MNLAYKLSDKMTSSETINFTAFRVLLPIIIGGILFTVFGVIEADAWSPQEETINSYLKSWSGTEVQLGQEASLTNGNRKEASRKQLETMILWNAYGASDCELFANTILTSQVARGDADYEVDGFSALKTDQLKNSDYGAEKRAQFKTDGIFFLYHFPEKGFQHLTKDTEFNSVCAGAAGPVFELKQQAIETLNLDQWCLSVGNVCASREKAERDTKDMEGQFGRMRFNVTETFTIGEDNYNQIAAFGVPQSNYDYAESNNNVNSVDVGFNGGPTIWRGGRAISLVPSGLNLENPSNYVDSGGSNNDPGINNCIRGTSLVPGEVQGGSAWQPGAFSSDSEAIKHYLYSGRVRMINVPLIVPDPGVINAVETGNENVIDERGNEDCSYKDELRYLMKNSHYKFCKMARGYIQSNAGQISNEGEASGENPLIEDRVYPRLKIKENPAGGEHEVPGCEGLDETNRVSTAQVSDENDDTVECSRSEAINGEFTDFLVVGDNTGDGNTIRQKMVCAYGKQSIELNGYSGRIDNVYSPGLEPNQCLQSRTEYSILEHFEEIDSKSNSEHRYVNSGNFGYHEISADVPGESQTKIVYNTDRYSDSTSFRIRFDVLTDERPVVKVILKNKQGEEIGYAEVDGELSDLNAGIKGNEKSFDTEDQGRRTVEIKPSQNEIVINDDNAGVRVTESFEKPAKIEFIAKEKGGREDRPIDFQARLAEFRVMTKGFKGCN